MATSTSRRGRGVLLLFVAATLAFFVALAGVNLSRSTSASGEVAHVGGSAFGESVHVQALLGVKVDSGPMPSVELPPGGGGPITDNLAGVDVPGLLTAAVLEVSTEGSPGPTGSVKSSATVTTLQLAGGVVSVDVVKSECTASSSGATGSATLQNLRIAGAPVANLNPAPNTTIDVPATGTLILNEQIPDPAGQGGITVNAVHLRLNSVLLGTGDVIVAQARCQTTGPEVVIPVGAVGGIGLAALLGGLFVWKLTRKPSGPSAGPDLTPAI